ncbi:MAG: polyprenyl synthetase family protein [Hoeflea sp.]|uniref:polyprenyl synthetase family protein n=1 Tax=Hoeflea sp. TaxID=1940281 RepID=UPI001DAE9E93|nr:farnesyl diphosphate synthase [Hoeflea sp.]MBU4529925.1 polyprenyl synthetase family protein [Alphaproteobacteria bacterium]MBU4547054.1 polyprenyl synthetase family protein [Alphaproteobacteria bacterium]MBU4548667.1 polyprenyl synthetase family protein [Alphaproteobacteria bacterium]MBV1722418.1 polyprenyl synthetase family protein [Hoeflea sp.]MBV1762426.1 polyprenyl synthetase family protein [Hoeflea sp.]
MDRVHTDSFAARLDAAAQDVAALLAALLSDMPLDGEIARPQQLMSAMRHGVLNGGKRLRPFLVLETARLLGGPEAAALRVAAALECIHCYSLIHDDLPAMDDDDLRRGQPTVHIAFDEATAILAGDALLTLAFDILSAPETVLPDCTRLALINQLARASGAGGMVGGQALDLQAERVSPDEAGVVRLQAMKTGALLRYACAAGAIASGADAETLARMTRFGDVIGLAFQLADDLLDVTSDAATLGKAAGKDAGRGKATLVSLHGVDAARRKLDGLVEEAALLLEPFGAGAGPLIEAAGFIASRDR